MFVQKLHDAVSGYTKLELSFNVDDFFLVVRTASLANSVRHHQLTAFAALH
jgi:hypothetical protein